MAHTIDEDSLASLASFPSLASLSSSSTSPASSLTAPRVLSGIQPSGQLHLGNYFGSIKPNLEMAGQGQENIFFIADLHAMTTVRDCSALQQARADIILDYLACGFDPQQSILFYQSHVPAHAQLLWILSTIAPMGLLERAVSYKEKVEKGIAASVGLFTYPVLMAADILLYDALLVPVGKDQKQHVEIARDLAGKFNSAFGETFVLPEPVIRAETAIVPGTDGQKMSKSYGNTIPLFGDEKAIKKAIMGIVTDSCAVNDPKNPEGCVVFQIHKLFLDEGDQKALADEYRNGLPYGEGKKRLLSTYMDSFAPMRLRREELASKPEYVSAVIAEGAAKARAIADATLERVEKAVGLR